jgi:LmbE family N-acetylglucosaminyl deacetylase
MEERRLMCVLAHPDDESLGIGSTLARYAAEGVAISLVTATRGERGWPGDPQSYPGPEELGQIRTGELLAAAEVLGVQEVNFLGHGDGELDDVDAAHVVGQIVRELRRWQPQVVLTFSPDGSYGHPDHIAISQLTTAATVAAADATYTVSQSDDPAHRVSKLYYMVETAEELALYSSIFGDLAMTVDGVARNAPGWPEWAITTRIDGDDYWRTAWEAIQCHRSQLPALAEMTAAVQTHHEMLLGVRHFYRAFSLVNGGRALESDLFAGITQS